MYFSFACLLTTSALLAAGLFLSHRIAGPIYQLRKQIKLSTESGQLKEVHFRGGDYFQELAQDYNEMVRRINGTSEDPASGAIAEEEPKTKPETKTTNSHPSDDSGESSN